MGTSISLTHGYSCAHNPHQSRFLPNLCKSHYCFGNQYVELFKQKKRKLHRNAARKKKSGLKQMWLYFNTSRLCGVRNQDMWTFNSNQRWIFFNVETWSSVFPFVCVSESGSAAAREPSPHRRSSCGRIRCVRTRHACVVSASWHVLAGLFFYAAAFFSPAAPNGNLMMLMEQLKSEFSSFFFLFFTLH